MKPTWMRAGAAIVLLALGAYAAWSSIPGARNIFDPDQVAVIRQMTASQFWLQPSRHADGTTPTPSGWRVAPGSEISFQVVQFPGILRGKFRAATPAGAALTVSRRMADGQTEALMHWLIPAGNGAESAVYHLLCQPGALPAGSVEIIMSVDRDSAGAAEWHEFDQISLERAPQLSHFGLPLLFYAGFAYPTAAEKWLMIHAPAKILLDLPAGLRDFRTGFGFNPSLFTQASASDGLEYGFTQILPDKTTPLLRRLLDPTREEDRQLQEVVLTRADTRPARLLVEINPGPQQSNAWDWAVWTGCQPVP